MFLHTSRETGIELATKTADLDFAVLVQTRMRRLDVMYTQPSFLTLRASLHHSLLFGLRQLGRLRSIALSPYF